MAKLSQNEKIGVGVAFVALLIFVPIITSIFNVGNSSGFSSSNSWFSSANQSANPYSINQGEILDFENRDLIVGTGAEAQFGDVVHVHYVGQLKNGDVFDTSTGFSEPFSTTLGEGQVIAGWDLGLVGMREGGTRHLVVPPALAYGSQVVTDSDGKVIVPSNSTLIFDVVLLRVDKAN